MAKMLLDAIEQGDLDYVKNYINKDNIDSEMLKWIEDGEYYTPLNLALLVECDEIAKFLIDSGAKLNCYGSKLSPLHIAAQSGNITMVQYLIDKGVDINTKGYLNQTPLIACAWIINDGILDHILDEIFKCMKILIKNGCQLDCKPIHGSRYEKYLFDSTYFNDDKETILEELKESISIRNTLSNICVRYIKNNREMFNDKLHLFNRDIKKLLN